MIKCSFLLSWSKYQLLKQKEHIYLMNKRIYWNYFLSDTDHIYNLLSKQLSSVAQLLLQSSSNLLFHVSLGHRYP
ncbi:hypothetical protein F2P79_007460 [Pimephales promelas]|nr:hypothetical protein F2P79_007460 [Pimephales promelas]